jgi:hypothetical protein
MAEITVAPDLFDAQGRSYAQLAQVIFANTVNGVPDDWPDGWEISPAFEVQTDDVRAAGAALTAARSRFMRLTTSGMELAQLVDGGDTYTPNNVSDVRLIPSGGVGLWTNTKGELSLEMANAMVRILLEELSRLDVSATISAPRQPLYDLPVWDVMPE